MGRLALAIAITFAAACGQCDPSGSSNRAERDARPRGRRADSGRAPTTQQSEACTFAASDYEYVPWTELGYWPEDAHAPRTRLYRAWQSWAVVYSSEVLRRYRTEIPNAMTIGLGRISGYWDPTPDDLANADRRICRAITAMAVTRAGHLDDPAPAIERFRDYRRSFEAYVVESGRVMVVHYDCLVAVDWVRVPMSMLHGGWCRFTAEIAVDGSEIHVTSAAGATPTNIRTREFRTTLDGT